MSPKAEWNNSRDRVLIDALKQDQVDGYQAESGWQKTTWTRCSKALLDKCEVHLTADQCKTRFTALKKLWKSLRTLRDQSGFGWDSSSGRVTASPTVWMAYINAHPKSKPLQNKSLPVYDDMSQLCGAVTATGANVLSTGARRSRRGQPSTPVDTLTEASTPTTDTSPANTQPPVVPSAANSRASSFERDMDPEAEAEVTSTVILGKRPSFRGLDEPTSANKRIRHSNAGAMLKMVDTVGQLISAVMPTAPAAPAMPSMLARPLDASPVRRDRAYRRIAEVESLTPRRLLTARVMFRGRTELADEYLSFEGADENEVVARGEWLIFELAAAARSRV